MKLAITILAITFYSASIIAQETRNSENPPSILELRAFLKKQNNEVAVSVRNESTPGQKIEDLLQKLQPSAYFYNGSAKVYGENPNTLFTDITSLQRLDNPSFDIRHIKIVRVKINSIADLNATIDLSIFSKFKNLKYLYFISAVSASEQEIRAMIRNNDNRLSIFYRIDKGDSDK